MLKFLCWTTFTAAFKYLGFLICLVVKWTNLSLLNRSLINWRFIFWSFRLKIETNLFSFFLFRSLSLSISLFLFVFFLSLFSPSHMWLFHCNATIKLKRNPIWKGKKVCFVFSFFTKYFYFVCRKICNNRVKQKLSSSLSCLSFIVRWKICEKLVIYLKEKLLFRVSFSDKKCFVCQNHYSCDFTVKNNEN